MRKKDLRNYTDWYLVKDEPDLSYACKMDNGRSVKIKASEDDRVLYLSRSLLDVCKKSDIHTEFRIDVFGVHFRGHIMPAVSGDILVLRHMPDEVKDIKELNIPNQVLAKLESKTFLKNGIILVGGAQGQGKSTTAATIVVSRLKMYGGQAITIEDPIEMPMDGWHGDSGVCIQTAVNKNYTFAEGVRGAMRSYPVGQPGILMIGEIRDTDTAAEACMASLNGLLVVATIHANSVIDIFHRMESLAKNRIPAEEVRSVMATGMRIAMYQEIIHGKLNVQHIAMNKAVGTHIHTGRYNMLSTELERQNSTEKRYSL